MYIHAYIQTHGDCYCELLSVTSLFVGVYVPVQGTGKGNTDWEPVADSGWPFHLRLSYSFKNWWSVKATVVWITN